MKLLTSQETAELLGITDNTLRQWRNRGRGPRSLKIGVAVMYSLADIEAWQQEQDQAS